MKTRVPANVDMPDRILAGLTPRQLAVLIVDGLLIWAVASTLYPRVPLPLLIPAVLPLVVLGAAFAIQGPGIGLDRLALLGIRFFKRPKRLVLAPEGISHMCRSGLGVIDLPLQSVEEDGVLSLGSEGRALIARATTLNLSLRAEREQEAIVEAFGRFLNSLEAPVHFLVRAEPVDLSTVAADVEERSRQLQPELTSMAREHAAFLRSLSDTDSLRREVFVCIRDSMGDEGGGSRLAHRIAEVEAQLRAAGVRLTRPDSSEAPTLLRRLVSLDTHVSPTSSHAGEVVSGGAV